MSWRDDMSGWEFAKFTPNNFAYNYLCIYNQDNNRLYRHKFLIILEIDIAN